MANIVTEHVLLLVPMMMVLMIFPMVTIFVVNSYDAEQRLYAIENAATKMGSTIQQVYLALSDNKVQPCTVTISNPLPAAIENQPYIISCTLENNVLKIHMALLGPPIFYDHLITLGESASWDGGTLDSNVPNPSIEVTKDLSGNIHMRFK